MATAGLELDDEGRPLPKAEPLQRMPSKGRAWLGRLTAATGALQTRASIGGSGSCASMAAMPATLPCDKDERSVLSVGKNDALADALHAKGFTARLVECKPVSRPDSRLGDPYINLVVYLPLDRDGRRCMDAPPRPVWVVRRPASLVYGAWHLTCRDKRGLPACDHPSLTLFDSWKRTQRTQGGASPKRQRMRR